MKYLFLLSLIFVGCSSGITVISTDPSKLKFKSGDEVTTIVNFYSNCHGDVVDYTQYYDPKDGPVYKVSFYCPNIGWLKEDVSINESNLNKR